jgi:hypothetical protein
MGTQKSVALVGIHGVILSNLTSLYVNTLDTDSCQVLIHQASYRIPNLIGKNCQNATVDRSRILDRREVSCVRDYLSGLAAMAA